MQRPSIRVRRGRGMSRGGGTRAKISGTLADPWLQRADAFSAVVV